MTIEQPVVIKEYPNVYFVYKPPYTTILKNMTTFFIVLLTRFLL